jgi:hypothetical protein
LLRRAALVYARKQVPQLFVAQGFAKLPCGILYVKAFSRMFANRNKP